ncbi:hypothetical protein K491DRAFT_710913 [Lophiostoma macrostomum CBS 122681]|uniref:Uncharacterized protein n=1 Tax=Lophiostoma macrostomum CBS 122681 TaxID=1314788 RepID=A0A6A6TNJ4_9PLEO|nr:hypothetical protein K491DRAFT_710913 [Lophiostoma macrostomum CBS 122681]
MEQHQPQQQRQNEQDDEIQVIPRDHDDIQMEPLPKEDVIRELGEHPTNSEILRHEPAAFCSTMLDVEYAPREEKISGSLHPLKAFYDKATGPFSAFTFGADIWSTQYPVQLSFRLPTDLDRAHHVFLVTSTHLGWPRSWGHWSLYFQGYFFHLSARVPANVTQQSDPWEINSKAHKVPLELKVENLSAIDTEEYIRAKEEAWDKPFIAFQIGKTQYSYTQIERLARFTIERLATYDLFERNYQSFCMSMMYRVIMTKRDCSMFVGNKTQFVDWDLRGRHDMSTNPPHNRERGFLVRKPLTHKKMSSPWVPIWGHGKYIYKAKHIRILYEKGPLAMNAQDPTGNMNNFQYMWAKIKKDDQEFLQVKTPTLGRVLRELKQDIMAGRWKDAVRGREETLQEFRNDRALRKAAKVERRKNGDCFLW